MGVDHFGAVDILVYFLLCVVNEINFAYQRKSCLDKRKEKCSVIFILNDILHHR